MQLIYDEKEVERFHSILPPLQNDEVHFVSMSARNKYLTPEERVSYDLGRSEMMGREIVKSDEFFHYLRTLRSYEHPWYGRGGHELPSKCLICYANINNSSAKSALKEFYSKSNELLFNLGNDKEAAENLRGMDTILMNCYQRARGTRAYVDIDIDAPDEQFSLYAMTKLRRELTARGVQVYVIHTHSGYHVLLNRKTLSFNYNTVVDELQQEALGLFDEKAEVVRNSNDMVPIPGTLQGGFEVRFVDFKEGELLTS